MSAGGRFEQLGVGTPQREACARRDGAPPNHIGAKHVEHRIADPRGKRCGGGDQGEWRALTPG